MPIRHTALPGIAALTGLPRSWECYGFSGILKFSGIFTKNGQGYGKVMEFLNWSKKSWKNHGILQTYS